MNDASQFLDTIYEGQRGYRELCYIIGDPDDRNPNNFHQERYVLAQREKMLARIAELQALGYNVYVGASTYTRPKRSKQYAAPSRWIVIDDAPEGEYTFSVQTSPNSRQAWIKTQHWLEPHDRERIARNAAYATGADTGGWDCTQLVRVPGGLNTKAKYGKPFSVHIVPGTGKAYHINELEARWPAAPRRINTEAIDLDDAAIARELARVDKIMRRIPTTALTYKRLTGQVFCKNRNGEDSRTDTRWAISCDLRARYRLPDAEIAALLITHNWGTLDDKGSAWLYADIARCIDGAHKKHPDVIPEPTHGGCSSIIKALPQAERKSRARKDRPQRVTPETYLTWLHKQMVGAVGTVMMTRKEIAAALSISVPTVDRLERTLREQGQIERRTSKARTHSYLVILGAININDAPQKAAQNQPTEVLSAQQPESAEIAHQEAVNRGIEQSPIEVTHRPEGSLQNCAVPASFRLGDALRAAIEFAVGQHGRVTKKRVQREFEHFFAGMRWSDREYERQMKRRMRSTQLERLIAWAQAAKTQPAELKRKARSLAYQQQRAIEAGHEAKAYALGIQANVIEDEIEARILRGEIRKRAPKRSVLPVVVEQQPAIAPQGRCVSSLPTVVVLPRVEVQHVQAGASSGSAAPIAHRTGTVDRLRALKAQRLV